MADAFNREALERDLAVRQEDLAAHLSQLEHAVRERFDPRRRARRALSDHRAGLIAIAVVAVLFGVGLMRRRRSDRRARGHGRLRA